MIANASCVMLIGMLLTSIACSDAKSSTAPGPLATPLFQTYEPPPPPPPPPPLSSPATTYVFSGPLSYSVSDYTVASRYVLYQNGAFMAVFRYSLPDEGHVVGSYAQKDGNLTFRFVGGGSASATLRGDFLDVRYDFNMEMSDYQNAVYRRSQ